MSLSVLAVMIFGNIIVSILRNLIPSRIRIIVQLVVVAVSNSCRRSSKAFLPDVSEKLSVLSV